MCIASCYGHVKFAFPNTTHLHACSESNVYAEGGNEVPRDYLDISMITKVCDCHVEEIDPGEDLQNFVYMSVW
jgi:hypothetical protein